MSSEWIYMTKCHRELWWEGYYKGIQDADTEYESPTHFNALKSVLRSRVHNSRTYLRRVNELHCLNKTTKWLVLSEPIEFIFAVSLSFYTLYEIWFRSVCSVDLCWQRHENLGSGNWYTCCEEAVKTNDDSLSHKPLITVFVFSVQHNRYTCPWEKHESREHGSTASGLNLYR